MSRTRGFDDEKVRNAIVQVFWERGYEATNLSQLEAATSLVRTSLYNAFGNKSDMFAQALQQYHAMIEQLFEEMTRDKSAEALLGVFEALMEQTDEVSGWPVGCLMVGAATQSATLEQSHIEIVRAYRAMLVTKTQAVLERDQRLGTLSDEIDTDSAAELLVCIMWGALVSQCISSSENRSMGGLKTLRQVLSGWVI
ncbi:hypothetical protein C1J03_00975 [Sulfitobacter sp. SK012]|uniref:TetR/AcrR family transcriptional regulator n=1 Tax=Sulfitobacter sp. SK012 TaxID=1389005 RepID=UPI000E0ACD73|nr:TetR/AcrR family transcriptional regulator [Sulfitobacter sp. SK012]AXI44726.1 hypothetical protein C1J03_00975 [Sulfitobacter sp. SK012]